MLTLEQWRRMVSAYIRPRDLDSSSVRLALLLYNQYGSWI